MNAVTPTSELDDKSPGLPRLVLEARVRLGPDATPEEVANDLRGQLPEVTTAQVRDAWAEGHPPG